MSIGVPELAAAIVATIAPFTPFLLEAGKASGKKFSEAIAQKGGEAAWTKARAAWHRLRQARPGHGDSVHAAAARLAAAPADAGHEALADAVADRLREYPELARDLLDIVGGEAAVQEVLAAGGSLVQGVTQRTRGGGPHHQRVVATGGSTVRDVLQTSQTSFETSEPAGAAPPREEPA